MTDTSTHFLMIRSMMQSLVISRIGSRQSFHFNKEQDCHYQRERDYGDQSQGGKGWHETEGYRNYDSREEEERRKGLCHESAIATIAATNTSIKMDKAMVDVVKTPGGRKETHEAEVHETAVAVSADPKIKGVNPIATMDKSKAKNC